MFCKNCGAKLDENAKFCTNCGNQVVNNFVNTANSVVTPSVTPEPTPNGVNAGKYIPINNGDNSSSNNAGTKLNINLNKKTLTIVLIVVGALLLLFVIIKLLGNPSNNPTNEFRDGSSSSSNSSVTNDNSSVDTNQSVAGTIDIHDFEGYYQGKTYQKYLKKKVTITNVPVSYSVDSFVVGTMAVSIKCDNESSLNLVDDSTISVTGIITTKTTNDWYLYMTNCSIS